MLAAIVGHTGFVGGNLAARLGFRVCEIPVARRYPAHGPVPTKISPVRGNLRVLRCLFAACLGMYNPLSNCE